MTIHPDFKDVQIVLPPDGELKCNPDWSWSEDLAKMIPQFVIAYKNQFGSGMSYEFPNGYKFTGKFDENRKALEGFLIFAKAAFNCRSYNGPFRDGFMTEEGQFEIGMMNYQGNFKDGHASGFGKISFLGGGSSHQGEFVDGKIKISGLRAGRSSLVDGEIIDGYYYGDIITSTPEGVYTGKSLEDGTVRGTFIDDNGDKTEGDFIGGYSHGKVVTTYVNGLVFEGEFKDGYQQPGGKYIYPDGHVYIGEMVGYPLKENGKGTLTFPDGTVYVGDFVTGERTGQGKYSYPDGSTFEGTVYKGGPSDGRFTDKNGTFEGSIAEYLVHLNAKLNHAKDEIKRMNVESAAQAEALKSEIVKQSSVLKSAQDELARLQQQFASGATVSQIENLNTRISQLTEEIEGYKEVISNLEKELDNARAENRESPARLNPTRMNTVRTEANEKTLPKKLPDTVASRAEKMMRK